MEKTTNYQLNQWEPEDQVRRTDFNEDNTKIDAALGTLESGKADKTALAAVQAQVSATPYVKLLEVTTTKEETQIDLDVSRFDLTQFQKLELHVFGQLNAGNGTSGFGLRLNGHAADYFSNSNYTTHSGVTGMSGVTMTENPGGGHFTLYFFGPHIMCVPYGTAWDSSTIYFTHNSATSIRSSVISTGDIRTINLIVSQASVGRTLLPGAKIVLTGLKL